VHGFTKAICLVAALSVSPLAAASFVIDLTGEEADGATFNILPFSNANAAPVTDVSFVFNYDAGLGGQNASWGSELIVEVGHLTSNTFLQIGTQGNSCGSFGLLCEFDLGFPNTGGIFSASGTVAFPTAIADASGLWQIVIADSFDDAGVDGVFLEGSSITVNQSTVPAPATLALLGLGLLGLRWSRKV